MIGYIKGKVLAQFNQEVIIENNGIGFSVTCSAESFKDLMASGQGEVYTYMAVREDDISLYGFKSLEEKNMFLKLITVSGIGPKMGMQILSTLSLTDLAIKIATSDIKGLSQVKGLGKKKAELIIVELREKMNEQIQAEETVKNKEVVDISNKDCQDAMLALTSLGFTKQEIVGVLTKAKEQGIEGVQALITFSLKNIK